ncbi:aspartate aminotransferase family protein [Arthrobacter sp. 24S4-2]|uniref:aminotransferase family protein n=1 Tax=Arthrobacter sp. 24S4-2 TaxID=2575374 RepID=UPI00158614F0|nr:aminotransferase class III-fold pyridoxal phosphate-dependent enzyme [Arthrobacter sp. 24S4-2]
MIDRAKGVWLIDTEGKEYLDGCSGAVVTSIGHGNPDVLAAINEQAVKVTFTHRGAFATEASEKLAAKIAQMTGYPGVWLVGSGSEAVEAAIQFALQYFREIGQPERQHFLSHRHGYHGNTLGALSLSGHARRTVLGGLAYDFPTLRTPYQYRDGEGLSEANYCQVLLTEARTHLENHSGHLAGVVIEAVGGATLGATPVPDGYLQGMRELCDEFGVLLIVDEVMTCVGRTGAMMAVDHWNVKPDLIAMGKGMAAGYAPIAAVLVGERVLAAIENGTGRILGGHTYAGNPLSCATALAVLDVFTKDQVLAHGQRMAKELEEGLDRLATRHTLVGDARGLGMLRALEFVQDRTKKSVALPQGTISSRVFSACLEQGLVVYPSTGGFNESILVAPPLTISSEEITDLLSKLDTALAAVERRMQEAGEITLDSTSA